MTDFSVVLFRPHCMLVSEERPMKAHKNQWLSTMHLLLLSLVEPQTKAYPMIPVISRWRDSCKL